MLIYFIKKFDENHGMYTCNKVGLHIALISYILPIYAVHAETNQHISTALKQVEQVAVGYSYSCALGSDRKATCWGGQHNYMLPPERAFTEISSGSTHACGITTEGTIVCWGNNTNGESTPPTGHFISVSAGGYHTCGIDINHTVRCWGHNYHGEASPPADRFKSIDAGNHQTCGIKTNDELACWGSGDGERFPTGTFKSVSVGSFSACAVRTNGSIVCWGSRDYIGTPPSSGTFVSVTTSRNFSCAIRTNGKLLCWGFENCASGNVGSKLSPPPYTYTSVQNDECHACAVQSNGYVDCWGIKSIIESEPRLGEIPTFNSPNPPPGVVNQFYSHRFVATGVPEVTEYAYSKGEIPSGLSFDEKTGILSGTPTKDGTWWLGIIAINGVHVPTGQYVSITIMPSKV